MARNFVRETSVVCEERIGGNAENISREKTCPQHSTLFFPDVPFLLIDSSFFFSWTNQQSTINTNATLIIRLLQQTVENPVLGGARS